MKKKINILSFITFLTIVLIIISFINSENDNENLLLNYNETSEFFDVNTYNDEEISTIDIKSYLNRTYFENNRISGFNSTTLQKSSADLDYIGWYNIIMETIEYEANDLHQVNYNQYLDDYMTGEIDDLYNLHFKYNLCLINYGKEDCLQKANEIIYEHYNQEKGLYFHESENDIHSTYIEATYYVHHLVVRYDVELSIEEGIEDVLLSEVNEKNKFCRTESYNIMNCGGNIIYLLDFYGYKSDDFSNDITEWYIYWVNKVKGFEGSGYYTLYSYMNLLELSSFFSYDLTDDVNSYLALNFQNSKFIDLGKENDYYFIDPQNIYILHSLYQYSNYDFPYYDELSERIHIEVEGNFLKNYLVNINLIENYYGIVLSKLSGYNYDNQKMLNLLNDFEEAYFGNPEVNTFNDALYLYFLLLSIFEIKGELDFSIVQQEIISANIIEYLQNVNYKYGEIGNNLVGIQFSLEILGMLEAKLPTDIANGITSYLHSIENEDIIGNSTYISEFYLISRLIGYESKLDFEGVKQILFSEGGFSSSYIENVEVIPDIISTMKICRIDLCINDDIDDFLDSLIYNDYVNITRSDSYMDLRVLYYYVKLSSRKEVEK